MFIIVAGAGRIGSEITSIYVKKKHDVVAIDRDPHVCETLYAETGAMTVTGSATNLRILRQAGADKADAIVCLMHSESDNIATALLAKSIGIPRIVARLINPIYEQAYKLAGINHIVRASDLLINQIMIEIEHPAVRKVMTIGGGKAQVYALTIREKAKVAGMTIKDVTRQKGFPDECVFMGVYDEEEDEFHITRGEYALQPGDVLFLISKSQFIKQAADFITGES